MHALFCVVRVVAPDPVSHVTALSAVLGLFANSVASHTYRHSKLCSCTLVSSICVLVHIYVICKFGDHFHMRYPITVLYRTRSYDDRYQTHSAGKDDPYRLFFILLQGCWLHIR